MIEAVVDALAGKDVVDVLTEVQVENAAAAGEGMLSSRVLAGTGKDVITLSGTTWDIQDTLISGGEGNDVLAVGIGSGQVDGGTGRDTLNLNFFDADIMALTYLGSGRFQLSGSLDKLGNANAWSQSIENIEVFLIGDQQYTVNGLLGSGLVS
jgi:Ca2+-binding RTX toxin-like protein